ncbi:MAG: S1 RNA-binding domain-containing protein [Ardenticatenaceae bacterium]|nr:S1 RNA-binding domain-containing protein [Ardenticatenaceae bacterium]
MSENDTITTTMEEPSEATSPTSLDDLKPKMQLKGVVKRLELYGAFLDVGVGVDALIHISKLGTEHVNRVADVLNVGDEVTVWVDKVDKKRQQLMVTMIEPLSVEWRDLEEGQVYTGTVSRLESYGAFVNIGAEREGLVHISELSHDYVKQPSEVVNVGDEIQVQVLGYSKRKRRIDLSVKSLLEKPDVQESMAAAVEHRQDVPQMDFEEEDEELPTAMEIALRRAMGDEFPQSSKQSKQSRKRRQRNSDKQRARQEELLNRTLYVENSN